jgi:hypothetical protein
MRRLSVLCAGLALVLTLSLDTASAQAADFVAVLTGDEEVPAVDTEASGFAVFSFVKVFGRSRLITARADFNLSGPPIGAHIHNAIAGETGEIVLDYSNGVIFSGPILNVNVNSAADLEGPLAGLTLQDLRAAMEAGETYINVHTELNPDGEIRGQITPE